ncbi:MAG: glycosyltransferase family 39 protein [Puniceicoccales bacterium]|jgi:4-amino-4-deoxy-L-arabinose transferase-like glycosyltransferase|nr:glycosyltransferase family 39 protein [Puniceicoccales bacterium]
MKKRRPFYPEFWVVGLLLMWSGYGLVGHSPWKPDEGYTLGLVWSMAQTGDFVVPTLAGEPFLEKPPFYYGVAHFFGKGMGHVFPFHDAARLTSGFFTLMTALFLFLSVREIFGKGAAAISIPLFVGAPDLCVTSHFLITDVSLLTGFALSLYGLCLSRRFPRWGGVLLGTGMGMGFLSKGLLILGVGALTVLISALLGTFEEISRRKTVKWSVGSLLPWVTVWPYLLFARDPGLFREWFWQNNIGRFFYSVGGPPRDPFLFVKNLFWQSGPAFVGAGYLFYKKWKWIWNDVSLRTITVFFISTLVVLSTASANGRLLYGLPLILPVVILGSGGFHLWRMKPRVRKVLAGITESILWIGIIVLWGAWVLVYPGHVVKGQWMGPSCGRWAVLAAGILTLFVAQMVKFLKGWRHRWLAGWAGSVAIVWGLLTTLWLPLFDTQKSYKGVFAELAHRLPPSADVYSLHLGEPQRAILDYYHGIKTKRVEREWGSIGGHFRIGSVSSADVFFQYETLPKGAHLLIQQVGPSANKFPAGSDWIMAWEGSRCGDNRERYRLFRKL